MGCGSRRRHGDWSQHDTALVLAGHANNVGRRGTDGSWRYVIRLGTMLRRELLDRRRYPAKTVLDAHMAVGVDDHHAASGPELVERFALLWPRAVQGSCEPDTKVGGPPAPQRCLVGQAVSCAHTSSMSTK
jgi:hypothetical protein